MDADDRCDARLYDVRCRHTRGHDDPHEGGEYRWIIEPPKPHPERELSRLRSHNAALRTALATARDALAAIERETRVTGRLAQPIVLTKVFRLSIAALAATAATAEAKRDG